MAGDFMSGLSPELLQQLAALSGQDDQDSEFNRQMSMANALRQSTTQQGRTPIGKALYGIGDIVGALRANSMEAAANKQRDAGRSARAGARTQLAGFLGQEPAATGDEAADQSALSNFLRKQRDVATRAIGTGDEVATRLGAQLFEDANKREQTFAHQKTKGGLENDSIWRSVLRSRFPDEFAALPPEVQAGMSTAAVKTLISELSSARAQAGADKRAGLAQYGANTRQATGQEFTRTEKSTEREYDKVKGIPAGWVASRPLNIEQKNQFDSVDRAATQIKSTATDMSKLLTTLGGGKIISGADKDALNQLRSKLVIHQKTIDNMGASFTDMENALVQAVIGPDPTNAFNVLFDQFGGDRIQEGLKGLMRNTEKALGAEAARLGINREAAPKVAAPVSPVGPEEEPKATGSGLPDDKKKRLEELRAKKAAGALK